MFTLLAQATGQGTQAYLSTIESLTPKNTEIQPLPTVITGNASVAFLFSPLLLYGIVVLFFVLFLGSLIVQMVYRMLDLRRAATSFVVALVIASSPLLVRTALETTSLSSRASSDALPQNIRISQLDNSSVNIKWETTGSYVGMVRFGTTPLTENYGQTAISNGAKAGRRHEVLLSNLRKGIIYEFEVLSGDTWYSQNGKPIQFQVK